jgi:hypothetical protein
MHSGERRVSVVKVARVVKAPKKMKKVQPEHTCGEGGGMCMLCETHGDVMDPMLPGAEFEGDEINVDIE